MRRIGFALLALVAACLSAGAQTLSAPDFQTQAVDNNSTKAATTAFTLGQAANSSPVVNGVAAAGTSTRFSRSDHAHPTDPTRAAAATTISTSGSLGGGGDLSANRTLTFAGDGAPTTYTPTVGHGGTAPTAENITGSWYKQVADKLYIVGINYTITTLGSPTGFLSFTLPLSLTAAVNGACAVTTSNLTNGGVAEFLTSNGLVLFQPAAYAAQSYYITCTIPVN